MVSLKYHYTAMPGYISLVTPQAHPINALDFGMLTLEGGQHYLPAQVEKNIWSGLKKQRSSFACQV